ncbi:hypothetical protein D9758_010709 [Tetrapyrgos nigripes]|uniref:Uncharacterized protein n=1 Tax=Tetrapyrgos nigripes TaxID=182062 RepID=A0A8H5GGA9_9AGAR|nr:hypothetical protein D9758_010709 [Tetrapyrgos nigripes]
MYSSTIQLYAPDYPVKSVTVFKTSRAEVVRTFEVDLKIKILGLPNAIDTDSVRVSGKRGTQELRLIDVFCTISSNAFTSSRTSISHKIDVSTGSLPEIQDSADPEEALRILQVHLSALHSEKKFRRFESELLAQYSKSLTAQHVPPTQSTTGDSSFSISAFLDEFVDHRRKNVATLAEIGERIIEVERRIAQQKERVEKRKGKRNARVDIVLGDQTFGQDGQDGQGLGTVEVKITYIVSSSSWEPTYELHTTTSPSTGNPNPKVTLHYHAYITQSTGENWSNASLTLSTISSSASASRSVFGQPVQAVTEKMPSLKGVHIRLAPAGTISPFDRGVSPSLANVGRSFGAIGAMNTQQLQNAWRPGASTTTHAINLPEQSLNAPVVSSSDTLVGNASSNNNARQQQQPQDTVAFGHNYNPQSQSFGGVPGRSFGSTDGGLLGSGARNTSQPATDDEGFVQVNLPQLDIPLLTASSTAQVSSDTNEGSEAENGDQQTQMQMQTTVVETPLAVTYAIEGKVTIPSDGVGHRVSIAVLVFGSDGRQIQSHSQDGEKKDKKEDVVIEHGFVPKLDARVFLQCNYCLFPGRVSVILDDGYIAKAFIGDINTGGHFVCTVDVRWEMAAEASQRQEIGLTTAEEDWAEAMKILHIMKLQGTKFVKARQELKSMWNPARRQITLKVGQVTNDVATINRVSSELVEILLPPYPRPPEVYIALLSSLAKAFLLQAEIEVTAQKKSVIPLAQVAFNCLDTLQGLPEIFFAKMNQRIGGWAIPIEVPEKDWDDRPWTDDAEKWKVSGRRERESEVIYMERVMGVMRLYFAILVIKPQWPLQRMWQLPRCWTWFARLMGERRLLESVTGVEVLYVALDVVGKDAKLIWGIQFVKLLALIYEGITTGLGNDKLIGGPTPEGIAARYRLQLEIEGIMNG